MITQQTMRTYLAYLTLVLVPATIGFWRYASLWRHQAQTINVGILYATTGPSATIEQPIVDSLLLAIEEVNAQGGILGKTLKPIIVDTMSQQKMYPEKARELLRDKQVAVIFGCLESRGRKAVKKIVEEHGALLVYPGIYEGIEYSSNIIYTGMIPNQFVLPSVLWSYNNVGKKFYLLETSSLFSVIATKIAKTYIEHIGGTITGQAHVSLEATDFTSVINDIHQQQSSIVINTLEAAGNKAFFKQLYDYRKQTGAEQIPVMACNLYEDELEAIGIPYLAGHYTAWSYYSSLNTTKNRDFIARLRKKFGLRNITGDLVEAAYTGVNIWARAVALAASTKPSAIKSVLNKISFDAPGGLVFFDDVTNHVWRTCTIGQLTNNGAYNVVWNSEKALPPMMYPFYSEEYWNNFVDKILRS